MKIEKLPDIGTTMVHCEGSHIAFITVEPDEFADNPLTDDCGYGDIVSLCTRHASFDKVRFDANVSHADCVLLGYFEHGACAWHVSGSPPAGTEGDYRWDGVSRAGLWIPNKCCKAELKAIELAKVAAKVFTAWCNGYIYRLSVDVFTAKHADSGELLDDENDYRFDDAIASDSVGGYYLDTQEDEDNLLTSVNYFLDFSQA